MVNGIHSILAEYIQAFLFFCVFILLVATSLFLRRLPGLYRSLRASNWPMTQGRVETTEVVDFARQSLARLGYSYSVEGSVFSGYFAQQFADEQDAWEYVDMLKGQMIAVRHQANTPSISAVRPADQTALRLASGKRFLAQLMGWTLAEFFKTFDWNDFKSPREWPTIPGRVESGTVTQKREGDLCYLISFYTSQIGYSYSVNGTYYAGHLERTFLREESARRFAERLKDKEVIVRYSPKTPGISRLRREDQPDILPA
jgi:hypothetical protein